MSQGRRDYLERVQAAAAHAEGEIATREAAVASLEARVANLDTNVPAVAFALKQRSRRRRLMMLGVLLGFGTALLWWMSPLRFHITGERTPPKPPWLYVPPSGEP